MVDETKQAGQMRHQVYRWCCCVPLSRRGVIFWALALILVGCLWLLSNLDLISNDWWGIFFPLILIGLGFIYLLTSREQH